AEREVQVQVVFGLGRKPLRPLQGFPLLARREIRLSQNEKRLGIRRTDTQKMGDGFPRLVARDENQPQVVIRASVRWIERERGAKFLCREVRRAFGECAVSELCL